MSMAISEKISLFRSQIENRIFSSESLQILETILVAKDVGSLLEMRSAVQGLLRSQIAAILGEIRDKDTDQKLFTVDFFVKAFALVGDIESCLALRYEALVLRDGRCIIDHRLRVSNEEWFNFAKDSFDSGFYAIAVKGFENALLCLQSDNKESDSDSFLEDAVNNIKNLRDIGVSLVASHSVQAESASYLRRKAACDEQRAKSCSSKNERVASLTFRSGINRRNMRKLHQSQSFLQDADGL